MRGEHVERGTYKNMRNNGRLAKGLEKDVNGTCDDRNKREL
jgi:hypothetical protein